MIDAFATQEANGALAQIHRSKQLLVEGKDDLLVFTSLLRHMKCNDFEVKAYCGKDALRGFLSGFVTNERFGYVKSIGVVRDADLCAKSAGQSVRGALSDAGLPAPDNPSEVVVVGDLKVSYLILPPGADCGALEDVCIESIERPEILRCVDDFLDCLRFLDQDCIKLSPKARAYAYLASTKRPEASVGRAAQQKVWWFDSNSFRPLKEFIQLLE